MPDPNEILAGEAGLKAKPTPTPTPGPTTGAAAAAEAGEEGVVFGPPGRPESLEAGAREAFSAALARAWRAGRLPLPSAQALMSDANWRWLWDRFTLLYQPTVKKPKPGEQPEPVAQNIALTQMEDYVSTYLVPAVRQVSPVLSDPKYQQAVGARLEIAERRAFAPQPQEKTPEEEQAEKQAEFEARERQRVEGFPEGGPPPPPGAWWNPKTGKWEGLPQVPMERPKTLAEQLEAEREKKELRNIVERSAGRFPFIDEETIRDEQGRLISRRPRTSYFTPEKLNRYIIGQAQARQMAKARERQLAEFAQGERLVRQVAPYLGTRPEAETQEESFQRGLMNLANIEAMRGRRRQAGDMLRQSMMADPNTRAYIWASEQAGPLKERYPEEFERWYAPRALAAAPTTRIVPTPGYGAIKPLAGQTEPSVTYQVGGPRGGPLPEDVDLPFEKFLEKSLERRYPLPPKIRGRSVFRFGRS